MARRLPLSLFCIILACVSLPAGALAAELGDARVVSHIGQQLVAEIELSALRDETAPVQVRLASADIYRGAGIAMPPVLSGLNLSVVRRGGRQFLNLASQGPVQSDYLHLYLELADGNERSVRLATLWFTPDPNPAPKPGPEPAPELKSVAKPESAQERKAAPEPKPEPKSASAFAPGSGLASAAKPESKPAPASPAAKVAAVPASKPAAAPARAPVPAAKPAPSAPPLPPATATPGSCPQPDPALLKTCVALDYKNAQLNAQLGQLEDKVKVLQLAMGAAPAAAGAPLVPAPQQAEAAARAVPYVAKPKNAVQPPEPAFPWLWLALGGAVLLAGAGAAVFALRLKAARQREARAKKAALPPMIPGVKNRLMPDKGAGDEAAPPADAAQE